MKYIVLVADGMADYPLAELGERTPLEAARTPNLDFMAAGGIIGRAQTIPEKMTPGSDVANVAILGYDPKKYYTGRGPLEAVNLGIELNEGDIAFRCNLVTISGEKLTDYSAGHITSKEASSLIKFIDEKLGSPQFRFYPGVSYRHLMVARGCQQHELDELHCDAPHDILGKPIKAHMPKGKNAAMINGLMEGSRPLLEGHEINHVRIDLKENPANMIWLWGQGIKPMMPSFEERFGVKGCVISAVDLIKGLGKLIGLSVIHVPGATGYYDTDYEGKARAALACLEQNDFVFLHLEAPDEAGHNGDLREKITAIERFDNLIVGPILEAFRKKENYRILALPDHPTPISLRTHTADPIPFVMYGKDIVGEAAIAYNEKEAAKSALYFERGHELLDYFFTAGAKNVQGS